MATTFVGPVSAKSGQLREEWQHSDGKAHARLADSWDDLEGVTKVAMLMYDTGSLTWVPFTGGGGGGGGGDASAANQVTEIAKLTSIDGKAPALVGGRVPVDPSGVTSPISAAALPLPAGAATSALQGTGNTSVANLDTTTGAKADAAWDLVAAAPSSVSIRKKIAGLLDSIRVLLAGTLVTSSAQLPAALTGAGNLKVSLQEDGGAVLSVDDNGGSLTIDSPTLDVALSTRLKPADTLAGLTNLAQLAGTAPVMKAASTGPAAADAALVVGLSPNSPMPQPNTLVSSVLQTTANTAQGNQINLAAPGAGLFHYIDTITIQRVNNTAAAVAADTTVRQITSVNLNGWAHEMGSALVAGGNEIVTIQFPSGLKSAAANVATQLSTPAGGAGTKIRITVTYRIGV